MSASDIKIECWAFEAAKKIAKRDFGEQELPVNQVVYKFPLPKLGKNEIEMPKGAKILHTHMKDGAVMIWAHVDPEAEMVVRNVYVHGTGQGTDPGVRYIGTCHDGPFVWHVFEK